MFRVLHVLGTAIHVEGQVGERDRKHVDELRGAECGGLAGRGGFCVGIELLRWRDALVPT